MNFLLLVPSPSDTSDFRERTNERPTRRTTHSLRRFAILVIMQGRRLPALGPLRFSPVVLAPFAASNMDGALTSSADIKCK